MVDAERLGHKIVRYRQRLVREDPDSRTSNRIELQLFLRQDAHQVFVFFDFYDQSKYFAMALSVLRADVELDELTRLRIGRQGHFELRFSGRGFGLRLSINHPCPQKGFPSDPRSGCLTNIDRTALEFKMPV